MKLPAADSPSTAVLATLAWCAAVLWPPPAIAAGPAAELLLPAETVGYASVANMPDFRDRWSRTQIGQMFDLHAMEPFLEDLREQATERDGKIEDRLGVTFEELGDAASGEVAFALTPPMADGEDAAVVVIADVSGRREQAEEVVAKIEKRLRERGATDLESPADGVRAFSMTYKDAGTRTIAYFLTDERFVACNSPTLAAQLRQHVASRRPRALVDNAAYAATLARADGAAREPLRASVTWWIDPFEYEEAASSISAPDPPDETEADEKGEGEKDFAEILRREGFDAVKGVGGRVALAVDDERDVIHATAVYAPGRPGNAGEPGPERFDGALRAFDTPNVSDLGVEPWAPRTVAAYKSLNVDVQNLFDNVGSLVDAFIYENAFENTLDAFKKDPYGPKIDLRDEIVAHLGSRVSTMTDYKTPITVDCERYLFVVEVTDEEAMRAPLDKWMESDGAERMTLTTPAGEELYYWEIAPAEGSDDLDDGLLPEDEEDELLLDIEEEDDDDRVLRRAAVCLHDGELAVGSDVEFLRQALFGVDESEALATDPDLVRTKSQLDRIAAPERASWTFTKTEESFLATYELIRTNQMPQAQTFFGRLLNRLLTTEEEREAHLVREQTINGSRLPDFEVVRPFLGPAARAVRSEDDGWVVVGVVLRTAEGEGEE